MNCFEARSGFPGLWRKTLAPDSREALLGHLRQCARCDRAFRIFALTGAPLYSDSAPPTEHAPARREPSQAAPAMGARPVWAALCAMLAVICAAGFAAYLAAAGPHQTLDDAITSPEPATEQGVPAELALSDFAG